MYVVDNDFPNTLEELFKDKSFSIHHQNGQRLLIKIHKTLQNVPKNFMVIPIIFGDVKNNHNSNLRPRAELRIPSINIELKRTNSLRYHRYIYEIIYHTK